MINQVNEQEKNSTFCKVSNSNFLNCKLSQTCGILHTLGIRLSPNLVSVERRENFFFQLSIHILSFQMCILEDEWKVWIGPCFPTRQCAAGSTRTQ